MRFGLRFIRKTCLVTLFGLLFLPTLSLAAQDTVPKIAFVIDNSTSNYQPILKGFREYTRKHAGRLIRTDLINIESMLPAELQTTLSNGYDLAITVGFPSTRQVIIENAQLPIFALMVNQAELRALYKTGLKEQRIITGIFHDQPFERIATLIKVTLPQHKRVGMMLSQNTKSLKPLFDQTMTANDLEPLVSIVKNNDLPQRVLERLAKNSDVIVAVLDENIYASDNIKSHLLTAFRHQIPVIGVTQSYTEIGALVTLYTDGYELGKQSAKHVLSLLDNTQSTMDPVYPESFAIKTNNYVMRSFGISQMNPLEIRQVLTKNEREKRK